MNEKTAPRKWKLSDLGTFLKNSFLAILRGQFLLRLHVDKYFMHIVYVFFLFAMLILISLGTEATLNKMEENRKQIEQLQITSLDKTYEVAEKSRRSAISEGLRATGSEVGEPTQPAIILKK